MPKITELINGYSFVWSELALTAKVTRLRMPSDGQVKGELEIRHTNSNSKDTILLVPTSFNFSSEPTRRKYAKDLANKLNLDQPIEWQEIFDYLSQQVQELARSGEIYEEVYPDKKATIPEQLVEGIIYKGVQNIIYGEKGTLKSTLAYLLGMTLALPWRDNPLDLTVSSRSVKSLVLDWETEKTIFQYCMTRLQTGMGIPLCTLYYRRCALPLADDIEPIQKYVEATGAEMLIIDSLGAAAGGERGELKGPESALVFNSALRKIKTKSGPITSLILGQTTKPYEDKKRGLYGSVYFTYYARNIFELCRGEGDYDNPSHVALFHRYCNLGRKLLPMGLCAEFDEKEDSINIEREAVSISEFAEKVSTASRIYDMLKSGSMSQKDLKENLGASYQSVGQALRRLARQEKVQKVGEKWGLSQKV